MASGFDYSSKQPFRLQQGRLGIYDKPPFEGSPVEGVNYTAVRLGQMGGNRQQERMILSKRRSLDRAVWNSYQAAEIIKQDAEYKKPIRCLINPNKLKQDYDDKILSVGNEYQFKPGDIFEWCGTNTYWICYLQDLTELAYFRGDIRKCSYKINWVDNGEKKSTYAAIRGPVETKIDYIQKHEISVDRPNYSLNILMPKNKDTLRKIRFHDLRHSCASLLLAKGIPMKEIQDWLGHSTYSTTANIYSHLEKDTKNKSANVLSNTLTFAE